MVTAAPGASDPHVAIEGGRALLDAQAATLVMSIRRAKGPEDPVEILIVGEGRVEPARGLGHLQLDLSGMLAIPGTTASPSPDWIIEVIWTPDQLHARVPARPNDTWTSRSRADARTGSGLVGRLPDEVLGLVKLVATSRPDQIVALEDERIDGEAARRWLVRVPVESAVAEGVPAEVPDTSALLDSYGVEAIDVEVWLVDGAVRRLRYEISREHAPYGGPDRTTVTYDWSSAAGAEPIVVPTPS